RSPPLSLFRRVTSAGLGTHFPAERSRVAGWRRGNTLADIECLLVLRIRAQVSRPALNAWPDVRLRLLSCGRDGDKLSLRRGKFSVSRIAELRPSWYSGFQL